MKRVFRRSRAAKGQASLTEKDRRKEYLSYEDI